MAKKNPQHPVTEKSLANLRPAKPGEIRNPNGKNGWGLTADLCELADADGTLVKGEKGGRTLSRALFHHAAKGNAKAIDEVCERLDPKKKDPTNVVFSGDPSNPVSFKSPCPVDQVADIVKMLQELGVLKTPGAQPPA